MKKEKETEIRRCQQVNCDFFRFGGCKECGDCKAEPFNINTSCNRCLCCENVPNSLRWGENEQFNESLREHNIKEIEFVLLNNKNIKRLEEIL